MKTIVLDFVVGDNDEIGAKSVVLAYWELRQTISCHCVYRALQNHGKVLEVFVASVEESATSMLQLEGGTILKKAKLETASVGDRTVPGW